MRVIKLNHIGFELETDIKNVKLEENIIYKAYNKLTEKNLINTGIKVILNKNIPMQAGLAGGSTDCACFLLCVQKLFDISEKAIIEIATKLGADVVPCMYNGAIKAEGIGNKITKIKSKLKYYLVIIKPNCSCSTKIMYGKLDCVANKFERTTNKVVEALERNDFEKLLKNLINDFELTITDIEEIVKAKNDLKNSGAENTLLAGSGACVFAIFKTKKLAKKAYYNLKEKYETYICTSYNYGG